MNLKRNILIILAVIVVVAAAGVSYNYGRERVVEPIIEKQSRGTYTVRSVGISFSVPNGAIPNKEIVELEEYSREQFGELISFSIPSSNVKNECDIDINVDETDGMNLTDWLSESYYLGDTRAEQTNIQRGENTGIRVTTNDLGYGVYPLIDTFFANNVKVFIVYFFTEPEGEDGYKQQCSRAYEELIDSIVINNIDPWPTYKNDDHGFSIQFPEEFFIHASPGSVTYNTPFNLRINDRKNNLLYINIEIYDVDISVEDFLNEVQYLPNTITSDRLWGISGFRVKSSARRLDFFVFKKDDKIWRVDLSDTREHMADVKRDEEIYAKMIASLTFE